ncbi:hypothetical protein BR93DRAFT_926956 [Coniochaeta sp. PMI_546]|nr:hypothetical protein BR93DRAFT_926956 [Coniochaeta sp. PMI_546]
MNKGQLKEYIAAGVSKEDFISRTAKALGTASQQQPSASTSSTSIQATPAAAATTSPVAAPAPAPAPSTQATSPAPAPAPSTTTQQPQPSPQVQSLLTERAARLEAQRKREAEQRRLDKGKAKAEAAAASKPKDPAQEKYSEELKRRQKQAREDRARVLQAIEDDKAARRAKASEREAERARLAEVPVSVLPEQKKKGEGQAGDGKCKLQIRLFDGSTVRGRCYATESLGGEVRKWLDRQPGMKGVGSGYGFKVILTPAPSRRIEVADEGKTLEELGLSPSATLVLVPVHGTGAGAYPGAVGGNPVVRLVMAVLGMFTGLWALIVGFFGSLISTRPAPLVQDRDGGATGAVAASGRDHGRKAGLRQLRPEGEKKDGQQFYNGNSTNFEPRKDDDDEQ